MADKTLDIILANRLIAVIRLDNLYDFEPLANTLLEGGIRVLEFTLTNSDAFKAVEILLQKQPAFSDGTATIGIGSVRKLVETRRAIEAGAQFVVSPIVLREIISYCQAQNITAVPGAFSPTEIAFADTRGAPLIKVFPANTLGPDYIKSVLAPMPDLRLVPTGGINLENIGAYLKAGSVAVGVGSALVTPNLVAEREWGALRELARQFSAATRGF